MKVTIVFYEKAAEADLKAWEQQFWGRICYKQRIEVCHRGEREYAFVLYHHKNPLAGLSMLDTGGEYEVIYCIPMPVTQGLELDYEVLRVRGRIEAIQSVLAQIEVNEDDMPDIPLKWNKVVIFGAVENYDLGWIADYKLAFQEELHHGASSTRMISSNIGVQQRPNLFG